MKYDYLNNSLADVWEKWVAFWNNENNRPIIDLFFEIITQKSSGINYFLNLCQALESYSNKRRKCEVKLLFESEKANGNVKVEVTTIPLQIRLKDLFQFNQAVLSQYSDMSDDIADIRNYYTHYGSKTKKKIERSHADIYSAALRHISCLHFLLLATLYKEIGLSEKEVTKALSKPYLSPTASTPERIFQGSNAERYPY